MAMKSLYTGLLIFLLFFNAAGAFYGGASLLTDSSGASLHMSTQVLAGSPFRNFFIPGIILVLVNGVLPLVAGAGLLLRRPAAPLPGLPFWKNRHWAWTLSLASGLGLMIWIAVQIAMLGYWPEVPIQAIYGALGCAITALTLLPVVQRTYLLDQLQLLR